MRLNILYKIVVVQHFFSSLSCGSSIFMCVKRICFFTFDVLSPKNWGWVKVCLIITDYLTCIKRFEVQIAFINVEDLDNLARFQLFSSSHYKNTLNLSFSLCKIIFQFQAPMLAVCAATSTKRAVKILFGQKYLVWEANYCLVCSKIVH